MEIIPGCAVSVVCPLCPDHSPGSPGPGRVIRNMLGWSQLEKTVWCGVWLFRGALPGENLFSSLDATGDWVKKGSYHTAWSFPCDSSCTCSDAYGQAPAIGPQTGERCWPLPAGVWRAIAPLMKPWCAEGEMPTAANVNLYRGWRSCVGWCRDDEPLFGECSKAKLIVSVSFGSSAVFRWRRQSCPSDEGGSCWLGRGDILVMDGQCQDEFLHRTDPGRGTDQRYVPLGQTTCFLLSFASDRSGMLFANVCAGFFTSYYGELWVWRFCFFFLASLLCFVHMESAVLLVSVLCTRLGLHWCASFWTRPLGGGRWGRHLCNLWRECLAAHQYFGIFDHFLKWKPFMLALAGQPSLHGYDACRFIGQKGHFGEIAGKSTGSSGGWALRGLGSNAPKVLIRREFCGRGSIPA